MSGTGVLSALERAVFVPSQSTKAFEATGDGGVGFTVVVIAF
jgi:hypothetical protein